MELDLAGYTVMRCCIDSRFILDLTRSEQTVPDQEHAQLITGGLFEFSAVGMTIQLDAEQHPEELGPALKLCRSAIEFASIAEDGILHIQFANHLALRIPSLFAYDA